MEPPSKVNRVTEEIVRSLQERGDSSLLRRIVSEDYDTLPVGILPFLEEEDYAGKTFRLLSDRWKQELSEIFHPQSNIGEVVLRGSIGCGKTTVGIIMILYSVYRLVCLKDPAAYYGLLPGSEIVFGIFNLTLDKASTGYHLLKAVLDASPWFQENCARRKRPDDPILLPKKNIRVSYGSLMEHALSDNLFGLIIDEANFYKLSLDPESISRAEDIYTQSRRRRVSRFQKKGQIPGLCVIISSERYRTSFVEARVRKIEELGQRDLKTKVVRLSLWEAKSKGHYTSGRTFRMLVGDQRSPSRKLEDGEVAPEGRHIIEGIPGDLESEFDEDPDGAIRDIAGFPTVGAYAFFPRKDRVLACMDRPATDHPFSKEEVIGISVGSGDNLTDYVRDDFLFRIEKSRKVPKVNPGIGRFAHIDLAQTKESVGICIGHKLLRPEDEEEIVYIDLLMRVKPRSGEMVDFDYILGLLEYLRQRGFWFHAVTYDRFQSTHSIQILKKRGYVSEWCSVGLAEYEEAKRVLDSGKVSVYKYAPLRRELEALRRPEKVGERPRHPPKGSDDVADAFVAVISHCRLPGNEHVDGGRSPPASSIRREALPPVTG